MNTDSREKYKEGSVLPPFMFGLGNIGLDLKKDGSDSGKKRLFVGGKRKRERGAVIFFANISLIY